MSGKTEPKIAIIHGTFFSQRGAERTVLAMLEAFPKAHLFTLFRSQLLAQINQKRLHISSLSKLPFVRKYYKLTMPLWPRIYEEFDLNEYDVVISSATDFSKGVITGPSTIHISYVYTPTRYLWAERESYKLALFAHWLRLKDFLFAQRPDELYAVSKLAKKRIEKQYKRVVSDVLYPPAVDFSLIDGILKRSEYLALPERIRKKSYFVITAPFQEYKKLDVAIKVALQSEIPLVIIGKGRIPKRFRNIAKKAASKGLLIEVGEVNDSEKFAILHGALAYLQPGIEDFGIAAVEAVAVGCPILVNEHSGGMEIVKEGVNGLGIKNPEDITNWLSAIELIKTMDRDLHTMRATIQKFTVDAFISKLQNIIDTKSHTRTA